MNLPLNTKIAGLKTIADWNNLKLELSDFNNSEVWRVAYQDYYYTRLKHRYLNPIGSIVDDGTYSGEGFSIMAIICSLIEFLESTWQGTNYRMFRKGDAPLTANEYSGSSKIFTDFLTLRQPFSSHFNATLAEEFYKCVRCGLLHEARTKGRWTISAFSVNNQIVNDTTDEIMLYRDAFLSGINNFISQFEHELINSNDRKAAFIRKFDNLCVQ